LSPPRPRDFPLAKFDNDRRLRVSPGRAGAAHHGNKRLSSPPPFQFQILHVAAMESHIEADPICAPLGGYKKKLLLPVCCLLELNMLCDCVTRGCCDHSPLTTASILGWRKKKGEVNALLH
jgi:hypothetical protein